MNHFFSTQGTSNAFMPPIWVYILMMVMMFLEIILCLKYHDKRWCKRLFWFLQLVQLIGLYGFYVVQRISISISLPLYHCRMAMFAMMLMKDDKMKSFFATIGIFGGLIAVIYPIMDKYAWPHVTLVSFYLGHFALFGNSFLYLLETKKKLSLKESLLINGLMNIGLVMINEITGRNYGFLRETPLISSWSFPLRFVCITLMLCIVSYGVQIGMNHLKCRMKI